MKEREDRKMTIYDELKARGLLAQLTDEEEIKELIREMEKINPNIEHNIFKSLDNVNLNCVLSYVKNGERHSFLDDYEKNT